MKVYICDKVYENFDLKDSLDMQFLSETEGKIYKYLYLNVTLDVEEFLKIPYIPDEEKNKIRLKLLDFCQMFTKQLRNSLMSDLIMEINKLRNNQQQKLEQSQVQPVVYEILQEIENIQPLSQQQIEMVENQVDVVEVQNKILSNEDIINKINSAQGLLQNYNEVQKDVKQIDRQVSTKYLVKSSSKSKINSNYEFTTKTSNYDSKITPQKQKLIDKSYVYKTPNNLKVSVQKQLDNLHSKSRNQNVIPISQTSISNNDSFIAKDINSSFTKNNYLNGLQYKYRQAKKQSSIKDSKSSNLSKFLTNQSFSTNQNSEYIGKENIESFKVEDEPQKSSSILTEQRSQPVQSLSKQRQTSKPRLVNPQNSNVVTQLSAQKSIKQLPRWNNSSKSIDKLQKNVNSKSSQKQKNLNSYLSQSSEKISQVKQASSKEMQGLKLQSQKDTISKEVVTVPQVNEGVKIKDVYTRLYKSRNSLVHGSPRSPTRSKILDIYKTQQEQNRQESFSSQFSLPSQITQLNEKQSDFNNCQVMTSFLKSNAMCQSPSSAGLKRKTSCSPRSPTYSKNSARKYMGKEEKERLRLDNMIKEAKKRIEDKMNQKQNSQNNIVEYRDLKSDKKRAVLGSIDRNRNNKSLSRISEKDISMYRDADSNDQSNLNLEDTLKTFIKSDLQNDQDTSRSSNMNNLDHLKLHESSVNIEIIIDDSSSQFNSGRTKQGGIQSFIKPYLQKNSVHCKNQQSEYTMSNELQTLNNHNSQVHLRIASQGDQPKLQQNQGSNTCDPDLYISSQSLRKEYVENTSQINHSYSALQILEDLIEQRFNTDKKVK
eukprot:403361136